MPTTKMTTASFKELVFDYENATEWSFKGQRPALIDFYADWCGPCKAVAPVLEQLADEYAGKLDIYKVNTDIEQELSMVFGIQSIPSLLFIPMEGKPMMQAGALPKHVLKDVIEKELIGANADAATQD
jgi:thioredoxin 1